MRMCRPLPHPMALAAENERRVAGMFNLPLRQDNEVRSRGYAQRNDQDRLQCTAAHPESIEFRPCISEYDFCGNGAEWQQRA